MKSDNYKHLELWELQKLSTPRRSCLFHLKPIGLGTPLTESLTGYVARLAEEHCLTTKSLFMTEIAYQLKGEEFQSNLKSGGMSRVLGAHHTLTAVNGSGLMAANLVQALEALTIHSDLRFLTMLSWTEVTSKIGLLRRHRAWCPTCYEEWRMNGIPSGELCKDEALSKDEWKYRTWLVHTVGELVASAPSFSPPLQRENIAKSLRIAVDVITEGNIAAFARWIEMPKNTVWLWHAGEVLPQLDVLLRVCYCLGVSLLDFLTQQIIRVEPHQIIAQRPPPRKCLERAPSKPFDSNKVQQALLTALNTQEKPPPTMKKVAEELGYDRRIIFKYFPALCRAIATKSTSYRKSDHERKVKQSCEEVRQIASKLHNENKHPSEARVSQLMTRPGDLRYKKVRLTLQEAQSELGT